jgi:hypothetical protein
VRNFPDKTTPAGTYKLLRALLRTLTLTPSLDLGYLLNIGIVETPEVDKEAFGEITLLIV